jgi:hypothetical protein
VIVVISVICGFALMQRGGVDEQLRRQNAAQGLKVAFERARFDSVKRRASETASQTLRKSMVTVTPTSFTLRTYTNEANGAAVAQDQTTTLPAGIVIGMYDGSSLTSLDVEFDMRGETGMGSTPQFYICNATCTGTKTNTNSSLLIVTPTGTVNLLPGSSTIPTFGVPSISPVPVNANINQDTVL